MSQLSTLQDLFQSHVIDGSPDARSHIVSDERADAATRLDVYHQAYRLRLAEILRNDFDGLLAMLGDDEFQEMALAYLQVHPSTHASVRWFGRHLAAFLATAAPYAQQPQLAEMAAFEWAWGQAFDAADAEPVTDTGLAAVAAGEWAGLRIVLHPSLQRLKLEWNVPEIFSALTRGEKLPPAVARRPAVEWIVWRQQLQLVWRSLADDELAALSAAARGETFASICEGLCEWHDTSEVPMRAATLLKSWLAEGLVAGLATG